MLLQAPLASPMARPRLLRAPLRSRPQGMFGFWQWEHVLTASSAVTSTAGSTASSTANISASSVQTATTQSGSANKVGPAAALAVALTALGFATLGF